MSLIGSLEQFDLANILRRIEVFAKTGLLVVKHERLWVEFYFRQGQLVCIGPVRSNATLVDRLLAARLLTAQMNPQLKQVVAAVSANETQIAVALINQGYLSREGLRAWSAHETTQILQAVLMWSAGSIYFEDDQPTPADRLLVALSVSTLLDTLTAAGQQPLPRPASTSAPLTDEPISPLITTALPDTDRPKQINPAPSNVPSVTAVPNSEPLRTVPSTDQPLNFSAPQDLSGGFLNASQLIDDNPFKQAAVPLSAAQLIENSSPETFASLAPAKGLFGGEVEIVAQAQHFLTPPQPVHHPLPPARIDTSFMTPALVLVPVDLSALRIRNPQVQLTPDQWRLFSAVDGHASLQDICQALSAPSEVVCTLAGELIAIGLVTPLTQAPVGFSSSANVSVSGMTGAQSSIQPSAAYMALPGRSSAGAPPYAVPIETHSQWGNGNNGTTFMVGGGWVLNAGQTQSQSMPAQLSSAYAPVGGGYR